MVRVYPAKDGWRWHLRSRNGRIVAESGEAYSSRRGAESAARLLFDTNDDRLWHAMIEVRNAEGQRIMLGTL